MRRQRSGSRSAGLKVREVMRHDPGIQFFHLSANALDQVRAYPATSRICGTLCSVTGSSLNKQAAKNGSAAFLLPAGVIHRAEEYRLQLQILPFAHLLENLAGL